ncbi:MAG TPA: neutral/alkaline non-lysosomal ceramidase N-terminal domain-containing protein [Terriglobales bacterium]|nr:neutral/alkaline non-lysosomal ceramidase N-terminal domain-containing protein [Terriglobales bacterium]
MRTMVVVLLLSLPTLADSLRAGAAQVVITPEKGAPMAGYYNSRMAEGTHDDLHAKALVLEADRVKVALVACDVISLPREITEQARQIVQQKTGITADHVMISATHDHTGPVILTYPSRYNLQGEMKRIAQEYTQGLALRIAEAVVQANAHLQPAQMRAAIGREKRLAFNRRYFMKDGSVGWNPGKLNPNILRPAGPTDPSVSVVYVETPAGVGIAAYTNFAMHQDTTGGLQFSADYSYTLGRVLQMAKGGNLLSMFTIGCAGNVNHLDFSRKDPQSSFAEAARIGAVLAGDVLKTIQRAPIVTAATIEVSSRIVTLELPQLTPDDIAWAHRTQATFGTDRQAPFLDLVRAAKIIDVEARHGRGFDAEVQVIALGDRVAFVSFPGEMFTEFGLTLKEDSPFPVTVAVELANGGIGYIPNRQAYPQGGYEVISSRALPGAGEMLMNSGLQQLDEVFQRLHSTQSAHPGQ